jgi:hypothetical protein
VRSALDKPNHFAGAGNHRAIAEGDAKLPEG